MKKLVIRKNNFRVRLFLVTIAMSFAFVFLGCDQPLPSESTKETDEANRKNFDNTFLNDSIPMDVLIFAANYLEKRELLEPWKNQLKKPITIDKLKKLYYVAFLEKVIFDTVDVQLYKFGTYSNEDEDRILIKKSTFPTFQVIGDSTREHDVVMIHRFIKQYDKFSDSLKLKLYEYCIDSYSYDKKYIE